ncbi:MAG: nucleoside triphosphate pyrophosphatase [bacterium]|nr:nucleoside triphosphate pyrophosphatase [bacterium]
MKQLVLASSSPRRKMLLQQLQIPFVVDPSNIDEENIRAKNPRSLVQKLSRAKAEEVAKRHTNAIILAADTVVVAENKIWSKPETKMVARRMLKTLSGTSHEVLTGFTLIDTDTNKTVTNVVASTVWMRKLTDSDIDAYVQTGEPLDKAGAYGLQDRGGALVQRVEGDYFNVVGLPLIHVIDALRTFGVSIYDYWKK